jgi:hypothetical protein
LKKRSLNFIVKCNCCGKKIMQTVACSGVFENGDLEIERDKEKIGGEIISII